MSRSALKSIRPCAPQAVRGLLLECLVAERSVPQASDGKALAESKQRSASQFVHQTGAQTTRKRVRLQLTDSSCNSDNFEPHSFIVYE